MHLPAIHPIRLGLFALLAAGAASACANAHPEQQISAIADDGRLVPLDSVTTSYMISGVKVIQRPNAANDVVAVNLYLLGGVRQLTPATQGIEGLLLSASEYGSAKYPGAALRRAWSLTGSEITISPEPDWTLYGFEGVRQEFDSSFAVFADRLMHPTLASKSVKLASARLLTRLRQQKAHPDGLVSLLADSIAFAGHPYGLTPYGTERSLATLDSATLGRYVADQMVQSRILLVVVGNVKRESVERVVSKTLATLPAGSYQWTLPTKMANPTTNATFVLRPLPTNYILGIFQGPLTSDPDYPAFRIATALLGSRVSHSVRDEHGLSYAAYAPFMERGVSAGGLYVSTNSPTDVLTLMKQAVADMKDFPIGAFNMRYIAEQWIIDYLSENSTSSSQADFLARAQLYHGDYRKASEEMESLRRVSSVGVRSASTKYFKNIQFVYVGDTTRIERKSFKSF
jgi:zinc protease